MFISNLRIYGFHIFYVTMFLLIVLGYCISMYVNITARIHDQSFKNFMSVFLSGLSIGISSLFLLYGYEEYLEYNEYVKDNFERDIEIARTLPDLPTTPFKSNLRCCAYTTSNLPFCGYHAISIVKFYLCLLCCCGALYLTSTISFVFVISLLVSGFIAWQIGECGCDERNSYRLYVEAYSMDGIFNETTTLTQ
jgi:hypothetical protein